LQKISIKYTATAIIKRLKELKFSHNPLLPFFIKQSPKNSAVTWELCSYYIWDYQELYTFGGFTPKFFFYYWTVLKKGGFKIYMSRRKLRTPSYISFKLCTYITFGWESVTNNFGTSVFLRTAVILNSLTPIDVT
jgi:hypothetical protein